MTTALKAPLLSFAQPQRGHYRTVRHRADSRGAAAPILLLLCVSTIVIILSTQAWAVDGGSLDWERTASLNPKLKVLLSVTSDKPFTISDLAVLADRKLVPADRDPGLVVGLREAVFSTRLGKWKKSDPLPDHLKAELITKFRMSGVYRVNFQVKEPGYAGPLTLQVTAPRDGFGKKLLASDHVVRPKARSELSVEPQGNRWVRIRYPRVRTGQVIKFHFGFTYLVDMSKVLERDLLLAGNPNAEELPPQAKQFLKPGYKIDPGITQAADWAALGGQGRPDARREYDRLTKHLKQYVIYDKQKRKEYFGGKSVYYDIDDMYQEPQLTLARGAGCCPDTTLVECAFLRARGVPCRTAGRFGHFYSLVYMPGAGWLSTSVTPTGIPLLVDPGPDFLPYQYWEPRIRIKTTLWEARIRIEPLEREHSKPSEAFAAKLGMPLRENGLSGLLSKDTASGKLSGARTREGSPNSKSAPAKDRSSR